MKPLLSKYVNRTEFASYDDFYQNLKITAPEHFNFAYDVVDVYAEHDPDRLAIVWCDDHDNEIHHFGDSPAQQPAQLLPASDRPRRYVMLISKPARILAVLCLLSSCRRHPATQSKDTTSSRIHGRHKAVSGQSAIARTAKRPEQTAHPKIKISVCCNRRRWHV